MDLEYTYWQEEDGWLVGYLNNDPEHWTQGKDVKELEEMLLDLYTNFQEEEERKRARIVKKGVLRIPA